MEGKRKFLRMYLCFNALKEGWKGDLRPLIGLDETFLKGKCKGMLLVAIEQGSMNHFYLLAWTVVDKETGRTWSWFLELLKRSLELKNGAGVTFISDMQKVNFCLFFFFNFRLVVFWFLNFWLLFFYFFGF